MNIVLIGAQGSGKGTQADLLAQKMGIFHLASGDLFREEIGKKTDLGLKAKAFMDRGELVPDEVTISMVLNRIGSLPDAQGVLLDGFPRTILQAQALDTGLQKIDRKIDLGIYLKVPREELLDRLSGRYICRANQHVYNITSKPPKVSGVCDIDGSELYQRSDDTGEAIQTRLDIFFSETIQLLDFYDKQNKLAEINGNQDIDEVQEELLQTIQHHRDALAWQTAAQVSSFIPKTF
ncbi:MAG: adenylate kinase [Chloroflexota bacterium]|nr:adenylate kinase [Chloroflexota bacterium]